MNKLVRRLLSGILAGVLMAGMCLTASAADFKYPQAYWALQDAWESAAAAGDPGQIISAAQQIYDLLSPYGLVKDVCLNLDAKCSQAAWASEIKGDLKGAITWLERQRTYTQWLDDNGYNRKDVLITIEALLNQYNSAAATAIYALTDQQGNVYSGTGAPAAGTYYGSSVAASRAGESAVLMYIEFADGYSVEYWIDYYRNHHPIFRKAIEEGGVIEVAWNYNPESTAGVQAVLSPANDSYISEGIAALGKLNATVLLRLGAEMNVWADCDPAVFIQAFQKVARTAHNYSNIKTVFSPNYVSVWGTDFKSFYPGDEYVDWIGMSDYHHTNYAGPNGTAPSYTMDYTSSGNDAYYNRGFYDSNPLNFIAPIASFAQAHNKPMMISECGFSYRNNVTGEDLTSYGLESLTKYYSYVNMIYPQVKAVFHFNHYMPGDQFAYDLGGSPALSAAYDSAIAANGAFIPQGQTSGKTWQPLDKVTQINGKLRLATYALFPGKNTTTVKYFLDDKEVYSTSQLPFYYDLDLSGLSTGDHTIRAEASGGQFSNATQTYTIRVAGIQAMPTNDKLTSDGVLRNPTVCKINDSNYFKIRDLAAILNGTQKQFAVGYDSGANAVTATSGQPYELTGTELAGAPGGGSKDAMVSNDAIYINGAKASVEVYKIDGSNYFKLRDLGKALNFYVGWTAEQGMFIDTTKPYSE